ncbi:MAG: PEP/pyruvate-binding domain-containing protein, partial [Gemmatimonadaceae bacterium]|nr:PEP/pyruvate-binding domain-containing protein [Gemmatimonadaceae bacterium]
TQSIGARTTPLTRMMIAVAGSVAYGHRGDSNSRGEELNRVMIVNPKMHILCRHQRLRMDAPPDFQRFSAHIRNAMTSGTAHPFIKWFADITIADIPLVGGKNASLGEMVRELASQGVKVPDGFALTAEAFRQSVRQAILNATLPPDLRGLIGDAHRQLQGASAVPLDVAVRSSATSEDLPDASFAGQQETYPNVHGTAARLETCKRCFAALFTDHALRYRVDKGFDHFKVALSIGVQRMVRSDLACSGVMFTIDTETGFRDAVMVSAAYGLGENVVQGSVTPDEYLVFKPTLKTGHRPPLQETVGSKEFKLVYDSGGGKMVKNIPVSPGERARFALTDDEVLELARSACIVEDHYSAKRGEPMPVDLEWAKDGLTGELFIVQARPETVQSRKDANVLESYPLQQRSTVLAQGGSIGAKIAT